ncbi:DUF4845 domain-containing protein [Andreprevotia chitinilytica]|uniref:DUF4845 domain-containing protein n=1 Tax=Andreprevotia chitinilytica TaxID=396808 RepID=UPI00068ECF5C|nr:DUF4845 domain-containing protein [Andreprevotia chitinilytica]
MRAQRGLSFFGFIMVAIVVVLVALVVMKVIPTYVEYMSVRKAIDNVVRDQAGAPPAAIKESFSKHAEISNISAVHASDLAISQTGGRTTVSVNYEQTVPLVANISLLFDFQYSKSSGAN